MRQYVHYHVKSQAHPDPSLLASLQLFHGYSLEQRLQLCAFLSYRDYDAGVTFIRAHEPGQGACILISGTVKIHVEQADGRNVILAILGPGQLVGEMNLADTDDCPISVVTLEQTTLLWIDRSQFYAAAASIPKLQHLLICTLASRLRFANARIQALATLSVRDRILGQLISFALEYGRPTEQGIRIPLRLTHEDLADLVGATRVHVSRILSEFKRNGLIANDHKHYITIIDPTCVAACSQMTISMS